MLSAKLRYLGPTAARPEAILLSDLHAHMRAFGVHENAFAIDGNLGKSIGDSKVLDEAFKLHASANDFSCNIIATQLPKRERLSIDGVDVVIPGDTHAPNGSTIIVDHTRRA